MGKNFASSFFLNLCVPPQEVKSISLYNQKLQKGEFFKLVRVGTEKQVLEVQKKSEKLTFEIPIWVKKRQKNFWIKSTPLGKIFFKFDQKMRKREFFVIVRVIIEKKFSEIWKKWKNKRLKSGLDQNIKKKNQKIRARDSRYYQQMRKNNCLAGGSYNWKINIWGTKKY